MFIYFYILLVIYLCGIRKPFHYNHKYVCHVHTLSLGYYRQEMNTKNQLTVAITVRQLKLGIVHMLSEPTNGQ